MLSYDVACFVDDDEVDVYRCTLMLDALVMMAFCVAGGTYTSVYVFGPRFSPDEYVRLCEWHKF